MVFQPLSKSDLEKILDIELNAVQKRVLATQIDRPFVLNYTTRARQFMLAEGTDLKYGARHLKRAIEHQLVMPLSGLLATEQIIAHDTVTVDVDDNGKELMFSSVSPVLRAAAANGRGIEPAPVL